MGQDNPGILQAIVNRHSVRSFKAKPLSDELLRNVMETAVHAPSAKNIQPWEVWLVNGAVMLSLRQAIVNDFHGGHVEKLGISGEPETLLARGRAFGTEMAPYAAQQGWNARDILERSLRLYDAPAAAFVCMRRDAAAIHLLDIGILVQTICLAAHGHNLGSCIIGYVKIVEQTIRSFLKLPEEQRLFSAVALGYPAESPINELHSRRLNLQENVHFLS